MRRIHASNGENASGWFYTDRHGEIRRAGQAWCGAQAVRIVIRPIRHRRDFRRVTCRTCRRIILRAKPLAPGTDAREALLTEWMIKDGLLRPAR